MKCPKCSANQRVRDGMRCTCGYNFTFNPKDAAFMMTDGRFLGIIRHASQNGTAVFTRNQLYAAYCRKQTSHTLAGMLFGLGFVIIGLFLPFPLKFIFPVLGAVVLLLTIAGTFQIKKRRSTDRFRQVVSRWKSDNKEIPGLIEAPTLHDPPPEWQEPDIYDYGVERILIVDRDLLVDLFVKNNVHSEHRMLVLSADGYPQYLVPVAQRLLQENPELPVFLLHDATAESEAKISAMMQDPMFEGHPVTDLGMTPADFRRLKRTKNLYPNNTERSLPVDVLMMPFLTMAIGAAMTNGVPFAELMAADAAAGYVSSSFDFG